MFKHPLAATLVLALGLMTVAPGCATPARYYGPQPDYRNGERRAYDTGYREGLEHGERDARDRRDFRMDRSREYRDAGGEFQRVFRDGFRAGYTEGFDRLARGHR